MEASLRLALTFVFGILPLAAWATCPPPDGSAGFCVHTDPMVTVTATDVPAENGKLLNALFHEVERSADTSVALYRVRSGGSVSSSMFPVRGACAVLRARGRSHAWLGVIRDAPGRMVIELSDSAPARASGEQGMALALETCALLRM